MRTLFLIGLTLCLLSEVGFSGVRSNTPKQTKRLLIVELAQEQIVELESINEWLNSNLVAEECPDRIYYAIHKRDQNATLLGYQVIAECPDAPSPRVSVYFDAAQTYVDPN